MITLRKEDKFCLTEIHFRDKLAQIISVYFALRCTTGVTLLIYKRYSWPYKNENVYMMDYVSVLNINKKEVKPDTAKATHFITALIVNKTLYTFRGQLILCKETNGSEMLKLDQLE